MSVSEIFVYGTLRVGAASAHLMTGCTWRRTGLTQPIYSLWHMSWYPGMTTGGSTAIVGDVFEVPSARVAELDQYEGPEYRRIEVAMADGTRPVAWVLHTVPDGAYRIDSGDWLHYRATLSPGQ